MSDREAMKLALEALMFATTPIRADRLKVIVAIEALRKSLAAPEPVFDGQLGHSVMLPRAPVPVLGLISDEARAALKAADAVESQEAYRTRAVAPDDAEALRRDGLDDKVIDLSLGRMLDRWPPVGGQDMSEKPEALRSANDLEAFYRLTGEGGMDAQAADELLEQHAEIERLKADNERLRKALEKYGRHLDDCALTLGGYQCTCGFNQQEVPR